MDNTIKQNFSFMQFASYTAPAIVEHKNKHWVEYGEDNDYYQYLIDLYLGSPTNNAAIKGIADLVYGLGLEVVKSDRNLKGYIEFKKLIKPDCIRAVTLDLKMLGQYAFHCVKSKDKKSYVKVSHWPIQTLRPERCNDKGEIEGWYFCADWAKLKRGQQPKRFASFGFDENENECILVVKPYSTGSYYFAPVDYQGGTQWADLECEISNYHINNIKNGLAPSMLINFNNGQPPEEVRNAIEGQINAKWSGSSNAGRAIISFNDSKETATEITPVQLSDAHNQYEFLSRESTQKIMLAHRIVSPMLLGIKDNTGLGNNADELRSASILFDNIVIRPFQRLIIEGVEKVLNANGISLEMYFKTLQPLEFTDLSGKEVTEEVKEQEMGFSSQKKKYDFDAKLSADKPEFTQEAEQEWIEYLKDKGQVIDESVWELIDESPVDDPDNEQHLSRHEFFKRFANPDEKSKDDKGIYLIRYRYAPFRVQENSRIFCKDMVANAKLGVTYRREDIDVMGDAGINGQFAPSGKSSYSIWKYKGGVYCKHQWFRLTYRRKKINGKIIPLTSEEKEQNMRDIVDNYDRVSSQSADRAGVPFDPPSWDIASVKTNDLPNRGSLKNK
jgi:hypothetical protein